MMQVILSKDAQKQYKHLPKSDQTKVKKKLLSLQEDPTAGKKLTGEFSNLRSLRAWPYRSIYSVNEKSEQVEVAAILHRQGAYG